jgi:glucosamine-6-phosphate deaminase
MWWDMRILRTTDYNDMSRKAANLISAQIMMKPDSVIGLATGETPIGVYKQLTEWYKKGDLDFSNVVTFNLDEYKGLDKNSMDSYYYFMHQHLFQYINIKPENIYIPNGIADDAEEECKRYDEAIVNNQNMDLLLLGIGENGHIAFNEPGEGFETLTHLVKLTNNTRKVNSRLFEEDKKVPEYAYTMGIKNIMQAKKIILIVNGEKKEAIMHRAFKGPITPAIPASILQLHEDVTIVGDETSLRKLK